MSGGRQTGVSATNGQVIATCESYESKAGALNGIDSVKRNAATAEIDDQSEQVPRPLGPLVQLAAAASELGWW